MVHHLDVSNRDLERSKGLLRIFQRQAVITATVRPTGIEPASWMAAMRHSRRSCSRYNGQRSALRHSRPRSKSRELTVSWRFGYQPASIQVRLLGIPATGSGSVSCGVQFVTAAQASTQGSTACAERPHRRCMFGLLSLDRSSRQTLETSPLIYGQIGYACDRSAHKCLRTIRVMHHLWAIVAWSEGDLANRLSVADFSKIHCLAKDGRC